MKTQSTTDATPPSEAVPATTDSLVPASIDRDPRDLDRKEDFRFRFSMTCIILAFALGIFSESLPNLLVLFFLLAIVGVLAVLWVWKTMILKTRIHRWESRTEFATWLAKEFETIRACVKDSNPSDKRTDWSTIALLSSLGLGFAVLFTGGLLGLHERPESAPVFRAVLLAIAGCLLVLLLWNSYRRKHRPNEESHPGAGLDWRVVSFAEHLEKHPADTFDEDQPKLPELTKADRFMHRLTRLNSYNIPLPFSFMDFTGYSRRAILFVKDRLFVLGCFLIVIFHLIICALDCKWSIYWTQHPGLGLLCYVLLVGYLGFVVYFGDPGTIDPARPYPQLPFLLHRYVILPKKRIVEEDETAVKCLKAMIDGMVPVSGRPERRTPKPVTQDQWNAATGVRPFRPTGDETPVRNVSDREVRRFVAILDELGIAKDAGLLFYARPAVFRFFRRTSRRWSEGIRLYAE